MGNTPEFNNNLFEGNDNAKNLFNETLQKLSAPDGKIYKLSSQIMIVNDMSADTMRFPKGIYAFQNAATNTQYRFDPTSPERLLSDVKKNPNLLDKLVQGGVIELIDNPAVQQMENIKNQATNMRDEDIKRIIEMGNKPFQAAPMAKPSNQPQLPTRQPNLFDMAIKIENFEGAERQNLITKIEQNRNQLKSYFSNNDFDKLFSFIEENFTQLRPLLRESLMNARKLGQPSEQVIDKMMEETAKDERMLRAIYQGMKTKMPFIDPPKVIDSMLQGMLNNPAKFVDSLIFHKGKKELSTMFQVIDFQK